MKDSGKGWQLPNQENPGPAKNDQPPNEPPTLFDMRAREERKVRLSQTPDNPALWVNEKWQDGSPGMFAVVIGVSAYDYLPGIIFGTLFRGGQLAVSALTAHHIFDWLRTEYYYRGCPLAKCWLLLSPSPEEDTQIRSSDPGIVLNERTRATFENCADAIREWEGEMRRLLNEHAARSRAFYFFSGHGMEIAEEILQLMFASDSFTRDPYSNDGYAARGAINTRNLVRGLKRGDMHVGSQFFFVDACRNDHSGLKRKGIWQNNILEEEAGVGDKNNMIQQRVLYAIGGGEQALGPFRLDPGKDWDRTVYGQALLEGLQHPRSVCKAYQDRTPQEICWVDLPAVMQDLIDDILRNKYKQLKERQELVSPDAKYTHFYVTQVWFARREEPDQETVPPPPEPSRQSRLVPAYDKVREGDDWPLPSRGGNDTANMNEGAMDAAREVFGTEHMARTWLNARVFSLSRLTWLDDEHEAQGSGISPLVVHRVERTHLTDASSYRITFSIPGSRGGHWLQLSDGHTTCAFVLPGSNAGTPRFAVELLVDQGPDNAATESPEFSHGPAYAFSRAAAYLATDNDGLLGETAHLWEQHRMLHPETDAKALAGLIARARNGPEPSVLVAGVGAYLLFRLRRENPQLVEKELRALTTELPVLPDGPVLYVAHLLEQQSGDEKSAALWFLELAKRGMPVIGAIMGHAAILIDDVLGTNPPANQREELEQLEEQLAQGFEFHRPGGLFTAFSAPDGVLRPEMVLALPVYQSVFTSVFA